LEVFDAVLEAKTGINSVTIMQFNNTMWEFITSMCPTGVGEDISNWLLNMQKASPYQGERN